MEAPKYANASLTSSTHLLTTHRKSQVSRATDVLVTFFALYLTTLFSLDTWAAARGSPYRAPGNNAFYRPANTPVAPDSYQAGMHGRGARGPGSGGAPRGGEVGRVDSRPAFRVGMTSSCGGCMQ